MQREIDFANILLNVYTCDWTKTKFLNDTIKTRSLHIRIKRTRPYKTLKKYIDILFIISRNWSTTWVPT